MMIKKLRIKFIILSMLTLFVLLLVIVVSMNALNYNAIIADADETLSLMAKNRGVFPDFNGDNRPNHMSPEAPYEARYFSVLLGQNGEVLQTDTGKIKAVNPQRAIDYATQIMLKNENRGFVENYRFVCYSEGTGIRITFLDCGRKLDSFHTFLYISTGIA
ncbi:MAG: two-component sensor histidine kinase, partial [Lachnospiraceae bacterium]|nr:two-component sensor histidine kinase [Lachnospiraceae bacterium]